MENFFRAFYVFAKRSIALVSCIVLPACIAFIDVDQYWAKAKLDPALQGDWKGVGIAEPSQNKYLIFRKDDDIYRVESRSVKEFHNNKFPLDDRSKSIKIGSHSFLIVKSAILRLKQIQKAVEKDGKLPSKGALKEIYRTADKSDKSGLLIRYLIEGDTLTFYHVKEKVIWDAIKNNELKGVLPKKGESDLYMMNQPVIDTLDEASVNFLIKIAEEKDSWQERKTVYKKIKSAEEDIKKSSKYPVSESTDSNRKVMVDLPELKYLAETDANVLLRHLKASPEWKVFYDRKDLIAYRRVKEENDTCGRGAGNDWVISLNGFQGSPSSDWVNKKYRWQIRHMFRFSEKGGGAFANEYNRSKTTFATPTAGKIKLKLESSDQGIESYLVIGKKGLYYEFFEQRTTSQFPSKGFSKEQRNELEKRLYTRSALEWVKGFLEKIKEAEVEIKRTGFCKELMPKDGIKEGKPTIEIKDGMQGGIFNVYAWVNPGVDGKVYLKVINVETGERLSEDRITQKSTEYMGWSTKAETLFRYNSSIIVYEGDWDTFYNARFELWVQPSDGTKERKLIETTRKINGWQR